MALQVLFRLGALPVGGAEGFRSMLAFWAGGAAGVGTPPAPVSPHRAQYAGIRPPKKKRKQKTAAEVAAAEILTARAHIVEGARRDVVSGQIELAIGLRAALQETGADAATATVGLALTVTAAMREDFGTDHIAITGQVRSDEDEAMSALFELMPWLKNVKIQEND